MTENTVNLRHLFSGLQEQMRAKLDTIKQSVGHPTTKGDATELNWINMLKDYLPKRYKVDKAFVIDSTGKMSDQIDIVIYDQHYSPFFFNQDNTIYIPAESVYAVFEVKPTIDKSTVDYACDKIKSVRELSRTSSIIIDKGGMHRPRDLFKILGGIVTTTSDWSPPFGSSFEDLVKSKSDNEKLDFGCALNSGTFRVFYEPSFSIEKSDANDALIFFFLTLLSRLQELGTVPAMDISEYEKVLRK